MGDYLEILKILNLSHLFLLPLLKIGENNLKEHRFINCFLDDVEREERLENVLYVLFQPLNMDVFQEWLKTQRNVIDDYDYEGGFVVVVYQLPLEFREDYDLFFQGKYSRFSSEFKKQFPQAVRVVNAKGAREDVISVQWSIFKRHKELVKEWEEVMGIKITDRDELWSKIDTGKEVLSREYLDNLLNKYKQLNNA